MAIQFCLMVGDAKGAGDNEQLACIRAETLPRVGDELYIISRRLTGKDPEKYEPGFYVVESIYWEIDIDHDEEEGVVDASFPRVFLTPMPRENPPELFCMCTDEQREKFGDLSAYDHEKETSGYCFNCGDKRVSGAKLHSEVAGLNKSDP